MRSRSEVLRAYAEALELYAADLRAMSYSAPDDVDEADEKFRGVLEATVESQSDYMRGGAR